MSQALQARIRRALISLVEGGSTHRIARMTSGIQGVAVAGLKSRKPRTTFEVVFTSHPEFLQIHEKQADVNMLISGPSLYLGDESDESMRLIRRLEAVAELPEERRWSVRVSNGVAVDQDECFVWLEDWLSSLMDDSPEADAWVRRALIDAIDEALLADIADSIELEIDLIAERRCAEA